MEAKHLFIKGIDQDISPDKLSNAHYFDALNMCIVTDEGKTSGSIQNVKGNVLKLDIPVVPAIWSVVDSASTFNEDETSSYTITINGQTLITGALQETFMTLMDTINNDPTFQAMGVRAFTNEESIYNSVPTLYVTRTAGSLNSVSIIASGATLVASEYSPNQVGCRIVGWVAMREDIILFTTNSTSTTPTNTLGQVWKFTYDKLTNNSNIELLYNNYINLSSAYPIANPGMIEARYENSSLQNVYWTDNYNPPRVINVADPMLYSVDPRILALNAITSPFIPIPSKIIQGTGGLKTGVHYIAYRLAKESGGETNWFPVSYGLNIVETDEELDPVVEYQFTTAWTMTNQGYRGGDVADISMGKVTNKAIIYNIEGLDTNYNRIEIAHIYKKTFKSTPVINIVGNEPVVEDSLVFTLTGLETDTIAVTLDEFLAGNEVFNTVGTLTAKDNYLFVANVKTKKLDLDWDARAYRFRSDGECDLLDDLGNSLNISTGIGAQDYSLVPEDHACINPNDSPIQSGSLNYLFQEDGTTFGGSGPNVSYKFIEEETLLDASQQAFSATVIAPYRDVFPKGSVVKNINSSAPIDQEYESQDTFLSHHSPYLSGFLKGYTRDEIYRFGIVFYDHSANPLFVKWIADIRMPHMWMPDGGLNEYDRILTYPHTDQTFNVGAGQVILKGKNLGIEFTVNNLDTISEFVSGYSIVRCKRKSSDRTVFSQGAFMPAIFDNFSGNTYLNYAGSVFPSVSGAPYGFDGRVSADIASFHSPEFNFDNPLLKYRHSPTDSIDFVGLLTEDSSQDMQDRTGNPWQPTASDEIAKVYKTYTQEPNPSPITSSTLSQLTPYTISETRKTFPWWDGGYGAFDMLTVTDIRNHSADQAAWQGYGRAGSKHLTLEGDFSVFGTSGDDVTNAGFDNIQNTYKIYLANYKRNLKNGHLSSQYGGNTFSQRSRSEYISTNHYQPITLQSTSFTNRVFGGDTYITIFDFTHQFYDFGTGGTLGSGHAARLIPVETTINTELRQAISPEIKITNKYILPDDSSGVYMQTEEFLYNPVFSHENDIVTYFPKPDPFIEEEEFDCRIYNSSNPKNNGEITDVWRVFKPEDYIEVDSKYGPINIIIPHKNRMFFVQDTATGIYQTNEKALVQDAEGGEIILGTGGLGQRFDYVSDRVGSKHKFSFTRSPEGIFFFDITNRRAYILAEGLKELQGLNGFFQKNLIGSVLISDNPYLGTGITSTYDYKFDTYYMTFLDQFIQGDPPEMALNNFTVGYNKAIGAFSSFFSFTPAFYINDKYNVFTTSIDNSVEYIYMHNLGNYGEFYGTIFPSYVTFVPNHNPDFEKVFDNFIINTRTFLNNVDVPNRTFDTFKTWNDYQDTGDRLFSDKARFIKRKWNAAVGGDQNNTTRTERIKSNYAFTQFKTNNQDNYYIILESLLAKYRVNPTTHLTNGQ